MAERLAIPSWGTLPRTPDDWVRAFATEGYPAEVRPEPDGMASFSVAHLGILALADLEDGAVTAIDFAIDAPHEAEALLALERVAQGLGWELHDETGDD